MNPILVEMDVRGSVHQLEVGVLDGIYLKVDGIDFSKMMDRPPAPAHANLEAYSRPGTTHDFTDSQR